MCSGHPVQGCRCQRLLTRSASESTSPRKVGAVEPGDLDPGADRLEIGEVEIDGRRRTKPVQGTSGLRQLPDRYVSPDSFVLDDVLRLVIAPSRPVFPPRDMVADRVSPCPDESGGKLVLRIARPTRVAVRRLATVAGILGAYSWNAGTRSACRHVRSGRR